MMSVLNPQVLLNGNSPARPMAAKKFQISNFRFMIFDLLLSEISIVTDLISKKLGHGSKLCLNRQKKTQRYRRIFCNHFDLISVVVLGSSLGFLKS